MVDADHVAAAAGDDLADPHQLAGLVLQGDLQRSHAAAGDKAPGDDPGEDIHVDVAAGQDAHRLFPLDGHLMEQGRRHTDGARPLGHQLLFLHQREDRGSDLVLADGDHVIHILLGQGEGQVAGMLHRNAVGKGGGGIQGDLLALFAALGHTGGVGRLYAVHLDIGVQALDGKGHAGDQTAAADGDDHRFGIGQLLQHLQTDRPLPRNDLLIVKGVDQGGPGLLLDLQRLGIGVVIGPLYQTDLRPQAAGGLHLAQGGPVRHTYGAADAHFCGRQGHALGVVARAAGDDTRFLLLLVQLADLIVGAPDLKAAGYLQVLCLQVQLGVVAQLRRIDQVGPPGHLLQDIRGVINFIQCQHSICPSPCSDWF